MKRRSFIAAAPAAVLLPMPAIAAAEHPNDKVRRLGKEIRNALADPAYQGFGRVTITASMVGYGEDDPDNRIAWAISDIQLSLWEKYPTWRPQVINEAQRCLRSGPGGQHYEAEIHRHVILVGAADETLYPQDLKWWVKT